MIHLYPLIFSGRQRLRDRPCATTIDCQRRRGVPPKLGLGPAGLRSSGARVPPVGETGVNDSEGSSALRWDVLSEPPMLPLGGPATGRGALREPTISDSC